jgi:hypothetical protein
MASNLPKYEIHNQRDSQVSATRGPMSSYHSLAKFSYKDKRASVRWKWIAYSFYFYFGIIPSNFMHHLVRLRISWGLNLLGIGIEGIGNCRWITRIIICISRLTSLSCISALPSRRYEIWSEHRKQLGKYQHCILAMNLVCNTPHPPARCYAVSSGRKTICMACRHKGIHLGCVW